MINSVKDLLVSFAKASDQNRRELESNLTNMAAAKATDEIPRAEVYESELRRLVHAHAVAEFVAQPDREKTIEANDRQVEIIEELDLLLTRIDEPEKVKIVLADLGLSP